MSGYQENFCLGNLSLPNNLFIAPLAGCSDMPFRKMIQEFKPGLFFCEMVKMDALVRHDLNTYRLLDYERGMHPVGAQLCGSKPELAGTAARIIEDLGFDLIDLNCGCPVDKVTKDGSGSGMLKNPELIGEVLSEIVAAVSIPVTVKVRAGWDENHINASEVTKIAESAGARSICIHGRTREQGYTGRSNRQHIKEAKEVAKKIKVFGNGDLFDYTSIVSMFEETGCDGVVIARGSMGQPWIIQDVRDHYNGLVPSPKSGEAIKSHLLKHYSYILAYESGRKALLDMRRVGCWYLKQTEGAKELRQTINKSKNPEEVLQLVEDFSWNRVLALAAS